MFFCCSNVSPQILTKLFQNRTARNPCPELQFKMLLVLAASCRAPWRPCWYGDTTKPRETMCGTLLLEHICINVGPLCGGMFSAMSNKSSFC